MRCLLALGLALAAPAAHATIVWYEVPNGDLSNSPTGPTRITLAEGNNTIIASVGGMDPQDWMALTVPAGLQISAMLLTDYDSINPVSFVGFQGGPSFVGDYLIPQSYLGYMHFSANEVGQDLLPIMADPAIAVDAQGFTSPLSSGVYTFFVQQFDEDTLYRFEFEVTAVPAPGAVGVGAAGVGMVARRRRRQTR